jgi:ribosomal protein S12 methylthiotransferase
MKVWLSFPTGCPRSMMDAALLYEYFRKNGLTFVDNIEDADIVVVSSCGFNAVAENESLNFLSMADKRREKSSTLITFGCLPAINRSVLMERFAVIPITRQDWSEMDAILGAKIKIGQLEYPNDLTKYADYLTGGFSKFEQSLACRLENHSGRLKNFLLNMLSAPLLRPLHAMHDYRKRNEPRRMAHYSAVNGCSIFNIRIAFGCMEFCSYCAIKHAMGPLSSVPLDKILRTFQEGLLKGYKLFRLVAEDVGAYGQDNGTSIVLLLNDILKNQGRFKVMIDDFHPKWLIRYCSDLSETLSRNADKISHVGLPIQSGSNRLLELMKRDYDTEELAECIKALRRGAPDLAFQTHVVVGFPGEAESDFTRTLEFLEEVHFEHVIVYEYGDRPGTKAAAMPGKVPGKTKRARINRLQGLLHQKVAGTRDRTCQRFSTTRRESQCLTHVKGHPSL